MKSLSNVISDYIVDTFKATGEQMYPDCEKDFWYVIDKSGTILIGVNTQSELVNNYVSSELAWHLKLSYDGNFAKILVVVGEFYNHLNKLQFTLKS